MVPSGGLEMSAILSHARGVGGPALRRLTFHQRADMLKRLAQYLSERKDELYKLSLSTGATRTDAMIDVDGGIGTLFVYAGKGRRELPNATFLLDGAVEPLGKGGTFAGQHIVAARHGVAVHINAFNFPCWGLLEKLSPALLAGVPVVTKPATVTSYVAHALMRMIVASGILPDGALQFILGSTGDLFDHLTCQDVVAFTGSATTAQTLQRHPVIAREAVRFIAERDSLNAAILAPDAAPGTPEFDLFIKEVAKEMTVKAGQKCTAIRRALAPRAHVGAVIDGAARAAGEGDHRRPGDRDRAHGPRGRARAAPRRAGATSPRCAPRPNWSPAIPITSWSRARIPRAAPSCRRCCCTAPIRSRPRRVHAVEAFGPVVDRDGL